MALPNGTVNTFLMVLRSKLTQYDKRLQRRQPNNYRLSHYFGAVEKIEKALSGSLDSSDPKDLKKMQALMLRHFSTDLQGRPTLSPIKNVMGQIDDFLKTGQTPTLTRRRRASLTQEQVLRNKIIRLAHANPELRKDLLPLLNKKEAASKIMESKESFFKAVKKRIRDLSKLAREKNPQFYTVIGGSEIKNHRDVETALKALWKAHEEGEKQLALRSDMSLSDIAPKLKDALSGASGNLKEELKDADVEIDWFYLEKGKLSSTIMATKDGDYFDLYKKNY